MGTKLELPGVQAVLGDPRVLEAIVLEIPLLPVGTFSSRKQEEKGPTVLGPCWTLTLVFFRQWEQRSQGQGSRPGAWESSAPESLTPLLLAGEDLPVGAAEL